MAVGNAIQMQFSKGLTEQQDDLIKDANLLCGDTISNFRTIQSFGNDHILVQKFTELLLPATKVSKSTFLKTGMGFGLSQFTQFLIFGVLFWAGGEIMMNSVNEETG